MCRGLTQGELRLPLNQAPDFKMGPSTDRYDFKSADPASCGKFPERKQLEGNWIFRAIGPGRGLRSGCRVETESDWACLEKVDTDSGHGCVLDGWLLFERHRGEVTERAVAPRTVIEAFDVIEDDRLRGTTVEGHD